jgi:hypothetical protein
MASAALMQMLEKNAEQIERVSQNLQANTKAPGVKLQAETLLADLQRERRDLLVMQKII